MASAVSSHAVFTYTVDPALVRAIEDLTVDVWRCVGAAGTNRCRFIWVDLEDVRGADDFSDPLDRQIFTLLLGRRAETAGEEPGFSQNRFCIKPPLREAVIPTTTARCPCPCCSKSPGRGASQVCPAPFPRGRTCRRFAEGGSGGLKVAVRASARVRQEYDVAMDNDGFRHVTRGASHIERRKGRASRGPRP